MVPEKVHKLLNEQITKEFFSAYLYLDMANYYSDEGLSGFENWFTVQAQEERDHAMLMRTYLLNNDAAVSFNAIQAPASGYKDVLQVLQLTLQHEQEITTSIHNIYAEASAVKDFRTMQFLDWFIAEQGEEEKNAADLIKHHQLFASDAKGLYLMDQELGTRVYAAPSLVL